MSTGTTTLVQTSNTHTEFNRGTCTVTIQNDPNWEPTTLTHVFDNCGSESQYELSYVGTNDTGPVQNCALTFGCPSHVSYANHDCGKGPPLSGVDITCVRSGGKWNVADYVLVIGGGVLGLLLVLVLVIKFHTKNNFARDL